MRAVIHERAQSLLMDRDARSHKKRTAEIEELEELHRITVIAEKTADKARSHEVARLVAIAMFVVAALTILLLMSVRRSSLQIDLDLQTTQVSFRVDGQRRITAALPASLLAVRGIARADCPTLDISTLMRNHAFAARLKDDGGHLSLSELGPAGETRFSLATDDVAHELELVVHGTSAASAQVTADGAVEFGGMPDATYGGQTVTVSSAPGDSLGVTVRLPGPRKDNLVSSDLAVRDLAFGRTDLEFSAEHRTTTSHSGIVEGNVVREDLGNSPVPLAEAELLELDCAKGELRRVELGEGGLHVKFHGSVCGLHAGYDGIRRDLMPTWFEWIEARAPLKALWVSTFWLFTLMATTVTWWRGKS